MKKKINITINREDKKKKVAEDNPVVIDNKESNDEGVEAKPLLAEDLYAKELEIVLEEYIKFTKTYKDISKQMMNPIKMRRKADKIYEQLSQLSLHFNLIIKTFKDRAVPTEDLQSIHEQLLKALGYFEVYNNEFPDLMMNGNFKRINEVSKGLDLGHKGIKDVFVALEERERKKVHN